MNANVEHAFIHVWERSFSLTGARHECETINLIELGIPGIHNIPEYRIFYIVCNKPEVVIADYIEHFSIYRDKLNERIQYSPRYPNALIINAREGKNRNLINFYY